MKFIVMDMGTGLPLAVADSLDTATTMMAGLARKDVEQVLRECYAVTSIRRLSVVPDVESLYALNRERSAIGESRAFERHLEALLNPTT